MLQRRFQVVGIDEKDADGVRRLFADIRVQAVIVETVRQVDGHVEQRHRIARADQRARIQAHAFG
ncbi:hypothetical protein D3C71_2035070 [compost metagenome]